jgi:hypothetical protein
MPLIDDGNLGQPAGGTEPPTSSPSGGQSQQLSNVDALVKQVESLQKEIRGLQKGTDKRFEKFGGDIKRILELKEQGLDENGIKRELFLDSLINGQQQDTPPTSPVGNEVKAGQAPDVESAFKTVEEYGLSANDPDFIALLRNNARLDKTAFDAKVKDFVLGKVKPQKPANPADVVQSPAKGGATEKSVEALKSDYIKEIQTMRGNKQGIKAVQEKYRKLGFDPGSVDFRV